MGELAVAPTAAGAAPPAEAWLVESAAADASIARYLVAGERMGVLMDLCWKVCAGLFVLVAAAWLLGVLPNAIRLF